METERIMVAMIPTRHQLVEARAVISAEAATEKDRSRRDILDAAVFALEGAVIRRELYDICRSDGCFPRGMKPFCPKCGEMHHDLEYGKR